MNKLFLVAASLLLVAGLSAAYTEVSNVVNIEVREDGTAYVRERYSIFLLNDSEVEVFENLRKFGPNTVTGWKRFLPTLKYHVAGSFTPANTRVSARRLFDIGARSASVELEYDIEAQVFAPVLTRGRTTEYALVQELLAFERSAGGDIILSPTTALEITLPQVAKLDKKSISPVPSSAGGNRIQWVGPLTGRWHAVYLLEKPLSDEVSDYFTNLYNSIFANIPALLPVALLVLLGAFLYKYVRGSR